MIIGAGAVGVEFASMFKRFGSEVSVFEMLPRIVPVEDEEVSKELERVFKKNKIRVETGAKCEVQKTGHGREDEGHARERQGGRRRGREAAGRGGPRAEYGEDRAGEYEGRLDRGFIKVDEYQQTAEPGIYAIGDVVAGNAAAGARGVDAGHGRGGEDGGQAGHADQSQPHSGRTYTEPGIGSVGLTEAQAKAAGYKVKVGKFPFAANSKATILGLARRLRQDRGDEKYGEILGVHIIGPQAYELISEAVTAMEAEATVETMMHTIHAHPTIYEARRRGVQQRLRPRHQCLKPGGPVHRARSRRMSYPRRFPFSSASPASASRGWRTTICFSSSIRTS
jgi:dihydrolipoamide dehydrogenase